MTAIKHTLQREVFFPNEERLISVVHVTKEGKKKKASFLCAAVTTEKPVQATIYQVKKQDKGDAFKKKASWPIRQLKVFDAKYTNKEVPEFEVQFDKPYRWVASSQAEKNSFIQNVYKLSQMYVVQKPEFRNVQLGLLEESSNETEAVQQTEDIGLVQESDWKALSPKEETDLETMMSQCEFAISNAESFAEQLSRDLSVLDGANIHSIMGSEEQVLQLMLLLDTGLTQAMTIEEKLDEYEQKLQSVKDLMDIMKDKDALINARNKNHQRLLEELDGLVRKMDLEPVHMKALLNADLCSPNGIHQCCLASKALLKCSTALIHPSMEKMTAIQEQKKKFDKLKGTFAKQLSHHLNNLFIHQGNEAGGGTLTLHAQEFKLPQHTKCHRELLPYADLMHWLKAVDIESYHKLRKVYTTSLNKLYDREVKEFMESVKQNISRLDRKGGSSATMVGTPHQPSRSGHGGASSASRSTDSFRGGEAGVGRSTSQNTLDSDNRSLDGGDTSGRTKFDQMFEHILSELGPWCLSEQDFCVRFFNLTAGEASNPEGPPSLSASSTTEESEPWVVHCPKTPTAKQRRINEEVRQMMAELFPSLESELNAFEAHGNASDSMNCLYMLVRLGNHVLKAEDTGSFLSKTFANCLVQNKRNFDNIIQAQMNNMQEYRISKKSKVGIIPFVHSFEEFAKQAENIFKGTDRRTDLDKAYDKLIASVFAEIKRVSQESQKTPTEVVLFENYHHLAAMLSQLKIVSLEQQKKDAKQKYQDYQQAYVTLYLGQPMEKVHVFFVGIESKVAAGVRAEEVGYQLQFNKQELRKVMKEYTGKEVKKGLEQLCKKVEKHLCEEENLLQVVWHLMQDEFIKQIKYFESMIGKCYPDSNITFEFTIADLLGYFSDIAQSH